MTSFKSNVVLNNGWTPTFKVQGQVYHHAEPLHPANTGDSKYLQIYFLGEVEQVQRRLNLLDSPVDRNIVLKLQRMLHHHNSYVRSFKMAAEVMDNTQVDYRIKISGKAPLKEHKGRFNAPSLSEVAIMIAGELGDRRDIVLHSRSCSQMPLQRIQNTHRSYDPLQYPLLFVRGEDGYDLNIKDVNKATSNDYYAYRMMQRVNEYNTLLRCPRLFQQYRVDMYAKVENERLRFIRLNQTKLRAEDYGILLEAVRNDNNVTSENLGKLVVLPTSFTGGPRYMHEYAQDGMTYVLHRGTPDLFITFTCNPSWPEITVELLPGQVAADRVDLVARVFQQKIKKMMHVIKDVQVFGKVACFMYSIEWQKRGLPHMHLLVWLQTKIRPDQVDSIINAEIPDKEDPILYEVVTKNMIHGPFCNRNRKAPCIVDGKCSKKFPRQMLQETQTGDDGYPLYRHRKPDDDGHVVPGRATESGMLEDVDNSWVVPYSPLLCRIFKAHINVEYCNSVKSIKCICKYVTKGSDTAMFAVANEMLNRLDEVTTYQQGRYISSSEAVWRLLNFPIHQRYPTVVHLAVHLEGGQRVYYEPGQPTAHLTDTPRKTTLTAFFDFCKTDPLAKTLLYSEVPRHFCWDASQKVWQIRKKGVPLADFPGYVTDNALGRVYTVHPNNREAFHMRLLLHHVRGPISFEHLKTVVVRDEDGDILEIKPCSTYTEACQVLGLVEDDSN
ncbi:ATP-dependent DNA helicase [Trichonephila clavipes]|nr:ATP-dependent DNA helicase [Trichonephila clavipes]